MNTVTNPKQWSTPPAMEIDAKNRYVATLSTSKGDVVIELYPQQAPKTVNNFVFLIRQGFYDGVTFHRVIAGFMTQGGDPTGTGRGGPGYKFEDEFAGNTLQHQAGALSMANAGPNTNGSQFFLVHSRDSTAHLDGRHTVFGLTKDMDVVLALRQGDQIIKASVVETPGA
jgi:peptidyl-prolyl cis-trans isomerase B (cyclophilin B)